MLLFQIATTFPVDLLMRTWSFYNIQLLTDGFYFTEFTLY